MIVTEFTPQSILARFVLTLGRLSRRFPPPLKKRSQLSPKAIEAPSDLKKLDFFAFTTLKDLLATIQLIDEMLRGRFYGGHRPNPSGARQA